MLNLKIYKLIEIQFFSKIQFFFFIISLKFFKFYISVICFHIFHLTFINYISKYSLNIFLSLKRTKKKKEIPFSFFLHKWILHVCAYTSLGNIACLFLLELLLSWNFYSCVLYFLIRYYFSSTVFCRLIYPQ